MADTVAIAAVALGLALLVLLFRWSYNARQQGMLGRLQGRGGKRGAAAAPPARRRLPRVQGRDNVYTRAEVARHCTDDDLWLVIRDRGTGEDRVYDVTDYVDEHPGGMAIADHAGGDATEGFHGPQHPPTVFELLETYRVGAIGSTGGGGGGVKAE
jgi:hypothetical protein